MLNGAADDVRLNILTLRATVAKSSAVGLAKSGAGALSRTGLGVVFLHLLLQLPVIRCMRKTSDDEIRSEQERLLFQQFHFWNRCGLMVFVVAAFSSIWWQAPISSAWAACCMRCAPGGRRSRPSRPSPPFAGCATIRPAPFAKSTPKSPIGKSISYALSNWRALCRYVEDGDLAIDNNLSERTLRAQAIGRKNWLFVGSDNGGRTAAVLFSMTASCKRHDIDPLAWLRDVFRRLPTQPAHRLEELLPDVWFADHPEGRRKRAA